MTRACFYKAGKLYSSFEIEGHALLSLDTPDVLCAAISGMTNLVVNTLVEVLSAELDLNIDDRKPSIKAKIVSCPNDSRQALDAIIQGFVLQLQDMEKQYPDNLCVKVKENTTKGTKNHD